MSERNPEGGYTRNRRETPDISEDDQWLQRLRVVRELWFLREQARVRAVGQEFLQRLERVVREHAAQVTTLVNNSSSRTNVGTYSLYHFYFHKKIQSFVLGRRKQRCNCGWRDWTTRSDLNYGLEPHVEIPGVPQEHSVSTSAPSTHVLEVFPGRFDDLSSRMRADSRDNIQGRHVVSNTLESRFREDLERLLLGRLRSPDFLPPQVLNRNEHDMLLFGDDQDWRHDPEISNEHSSHEDVSMERNIDYLKKAVQILQRDVASLKNIVNASFDIQLDIQRSIRQELAGVLSGCSSTESNPKLYSQWKASEKNCLIEGTSFSRGVCVICADAAADSLLYRCGHLCTCAMCGRQLIATGQVSIPTTS
ncbi:protein binding protein / zinc ion binding protein [Galdieria sulphuraria]|uniref:Protein binding protein / zinc ion binding protein n=1 Tax=Galdieria sulphuraria TaxID=130081 RepID=M2Y3D5_GALSU|nr:protein binding protein / zinc ion binding protein [Galdieria sulphuraria]EME30483.1 protein binding protein / zinc ion binding protein [Galdieria sulphuraria]|eukprot:XP_005707003.1 protein binding protein / zinc ion binding protein [Galdieria sulphuraria]